jgi:tripartite-type tricarboxylate transporter receptor subunit TctC
MTWRRCFYFLLPLFFPAAVFAQPAAYPIKPVRLIVPFAAAGGSDIMARILAQRLTQVWGQQVVVDNRGGGGTVVGTEMTVHSPPDGYTMMLANMSLALNPGLREKLPYDALRDLTPIILIASQATAVCAATAFAASSVKELIARAKAGGLSYGSSGTGGAGHIAGHMFAKAIRTTMVHVPYQGGGPAAAGLMGGRIPIAFVGLPTVTAHFKAGRLKVLAVTDSKRSSALPDIPTVGETIPGFAVDNWLGLLGPAGMPKALVEKLNADTLAILRQPETRERLLSQGYDVQGSTPEQFGKVIAADISKYTKVIREAGIKETN